MYPASWLNDHSRFIAHNQYNAVPAIKLCWNLALVQIFDSEMSLVEYWLLILQPKLNVEHIVSVVSQDCKLQANISHDYNMIAISESLQSGRI